MPCADEGAGAEGDYERRDTRTNLLDDKEPFPLF